MSDNESKHGAQTMATKRIKGKGRKEKGVRGERGDRMVMGMGMGIANGIQASRTRTNRKRRNESNRIERSRTTRDSFKLVVS